PPTTQISTLSYTTLFRSGASWLEPAGIPGVPLAHHARADPRGSGVLLRPPRGDRCLHRGGKSVCRGNAEASSTSAAGPPESPRADRKSTRLNSSHVSISY